MTFSSDLEHSCGRGGACSDCRSLLARTGAATGCPARVLQSLSAKPLGGRAWALAWPSQHGGTPGLWSTPGLPLLAPTSRLCRPFCLQSSHQQGPFLRDARSAEKEGLLHQEALAPPGRHPRHPRGSSPPPASPGAQQSHLPAFLQTSFSFCGFLSGEMVGGSRWGRDWHLPTRVLASPPSRAPVRLGPSRSASAAPVVLRHVLLLKNGGKEEKPQTIKFYFFFFLTTQCYILPSSVAPTHGGPCATVGISGQGQPAACWPLGTPAWWLLWATGLKRGLGRRALGAAVPCRVASGAGGPGRRAGAGQAAAPVPGHRAEGRADWTLLSFSLESEACWALIGSQHFP